MKPLSHEEIAAHTAVGNVPAVYCGTYHKYNEGSLYGKWLEIASFDNYSEFMDFCRRIHADEKDPELMFQDYENFPKCLYSECGMDEKTFDLIKEFAEMDFDSRNAFFVYCDLFDEISIEDFEDKFIGYYADPTDYMREITNNVPEHLQDYIDWDSMWRDEKINNYYEKDGYIFSAL